MEHNNSEPLFERGLPIELISHILSYITRTKDKQSTGLVSREWWKITWDLTTKLDIYFGEAVLNKMTLQDFQRVYEHCNNVTELHLTRITLYPVPVAWLELFFSLPRVAHLTLTSMPVHDVNWLLNISNLKSLSIGKFAHQRHISYALQWLTSLTYLDLAQNEDEVFASDLSSLTNLVSLSFIDLLGPEEIFIYLTNLTQLRIRSLTSEINLSNITNLDKLESLILHGPIQDSNIDHIIKLNQLKTIELSYSYTHAVFAERGLIKLMQMSALTDLSFAGAHISGASWSLLTHMTNLKCLDLKGGHSSISLSGCITIAHLQNLKKLELPFNTAMETILQTIIDNDIYLESLIIHNCQQMTRSTLNIITQLTSLERLQIDEITMIPSVDLYEVTILTNLRALSLAKSWRSSDRMLIRPFLGLTKLKELNIGCHVLKEEFNLMSQSSMLFLESFHCRKIVRE